ncbi:hypothetical protein CEY02_09545 [Bacillus pumilus]|uniref:Uncharacterized protein n=1 Tax=Bacillus pumilus TaxID=1408 RepID=A0A2A5IVP5_BACPU|nr:hypothetical protein [Bacillus pumilus]PCK21162.1 hypothetical protein CEY02_09545 [Bacillus pumilus]
MSSANELVFAYRSLWKNRQLDVDDLSSLNEAIRDDLLDARTHPRARKSLHEKYVLAVERILESAVEHDHQLQLISLHTKKLRELIQNEGRNHS